MGGNIWENSVRLERADYYSFYNDIERVLQSLNYGWVVRSYFTKQSFGDMDIVYNHDWNDLMHKMNDYFAVIDYKKNGNVTSLLVDVGDGRLFQVDFIYCPEEEIFFSYCYFNWNDLGNLIGRLAHRIGLKFGHDGLWYIQRDGDYVVKEHLLTRDFRTALNYLDLNYHQHSNGFYTPEEIYKYVVSSKYFDYESVDLERRNYTSRIRDKKRQMYTNFLLWLKNNNLDKYNTSLGDKSSFLEQHFKAFPQFSIDYIKAENDREMHKELKKKFNGVIVGHLTNLAGKDLGAFMTYCKSLSWMENILAMSDGEVDEMIMKAYGEWMK